MEIIHSIFNKQNNKILKSSIIDTKLGEMVAIGDETGLYLLEFCDKKNLENQIKNLKTTANVTIISGENEIIKSIKTELQLYFDHKLTKFKTPIHTLGSNFQKIVWNELVQIPYKQTITYAEQAQRIGKQSAYRAVANTNGKNQLVIIIPCHRVINSNGKLGGYSAGIERKKWLLEHESNYKPLIAILT